MVYGDFAVYGKVLGDLNFQSGCGVGLYCGGSLPSSAFRYYNGKVALGVEGKELLLYASAFSAANPIDLGSSSNRWGRLYLSSVLDCYSIDATSIRCTSVNTQGNAITSGDIVPVSDYGYSIGSSSKRFYKAYVCYPEFEQINCKSICMYTGSSDYPIVAQYYNGTVAFGIQAKPLSLWGSTIQAYADITINGLSITGAFKRLGVWA